MVLTFSVTGCGDGGAAAAAAAGGASASANAAAPSTTTATRTTVITTATQPPTTHNRSAPLRHLQAVIKSTVSQLGTRVGVLAIDLSHGDQVLYSDNAGIGRAPASVEKLYTSLAVLKLLGPDARLHTDVLGTGHLGPGGVWHGNLYLRGDGDPTFGDGGWNRAFETGYGGTPSELVAQLRRQGIHRVTGAVYADASRFDTAEGGPATDNKPDLPDYGGELSALVFDHGATGAGEGPAVFAAREFVITMRAQGIKTGFAHHMTDTPPGARVLAQITSPPMTTLLKLMDVPSDDLFADLLTKQLGYHVFHRGTLRSGALLIKQVLTEDFGLHPRLFDGSGLDQADRSSPAQVVSLLRQLWRTADGDILWNSLPIVGRTGTVQGIGEGTAAVGRCVAKTGTLNYVTNLAGYCNAKGGDTVAFTVMIDGPGNWTSIVALTRIVGALAAY